MDKIHIVHESRALTNRKALPTFAYELSHENQNPDKFFVVIEKPVNFVIVFDSDLAFSADKCAAKNVLASL